MIVNNHDRDRPNEQDIENQEIISKKKAAEEISVMLLKFISRNLKTSDIKSLTLDDTSLIKKKNHKVCAFTCLSQHTKKHN